MKCANHPLNDSVGFCAQCGRPICAECRRDVRGTMYCETCLASRLQNPVAPMIYGPGTGPSPGVALALGFIPGVGAFYNGQFMKGMIQVLIFGSLIALSDHVGAVFGWGAAAFYFYMVIDSYNTAKRKQLGQPTEEWLGLGDLKIGPAVGAGLLITLGVLFLLDNLGVRVFQHITRFWPALLILVGLLILQKHLKKGTSPAAPPEPPAPPREGPSSIPGPQGM
jgi:TM2 domain-containing membrane protein YozV